MNDLTIFSNPEFGSVRTLEIERGKILFCGADVAKALEYARPNDAISAHCRYTVKCRIPHPQSKTKEIEMIFITEGDLYRLIAHSQKEEAERFEIWVFDEVLPQIRKTGSYSIPTPALTVKDYINNTCKELGMNEPILTDFAVCLRDIPRDFYILQAWDALRLIYQFAPDGKAIIIDEKNISNDRLYIRFRVHLLATDNYFETKFYKKGEELIIALLKEEKRLLIIPKTRKSVQCLQRWADWKRRNNTKFILVLL